jgi:nicotinamidase-related amidase
MPFDLAAAVQPSRTALLINECQRDVVGDLARLPALADVAAGALANIARLVPAARAGGAQVVFAAAQVRPDGKGANANTRINAGLRRRAEQDPPDAERLLLGIEPVPEIALLPEDISMARLHGMAPMHETGLDPILRNLGIDTIVVTGVSLNIAVPNTVMDAVNRGYTVVVPRDAVVGIPVEYGEMMLQHTIGYLAYLTTTDDLIRIWEKA